MNTKKLKIIHIALLIAGAGFILSACFHENLWFDESYSVALSNHRLGELISIGAADVHPLLYYILIRPLSVLTGNNIIALRLFSAAGGIIFALMGYTHIRPQFGEKAGIYFSLIAYLLPATLKYSTEIRMYSWLPLFTLLCGIYAYRAACGYGKKTKNYILFTIFGLASAYTHYFGVATAAVIFAILFVAIILRRKSLKGWIISAAVTIIAYLPGLYVFLNQLKTVSKGYWISVEYPEIITDTLSFFFIGDAPNDVILPAAVRITITVISCIIFALAVFFSVRMCRKSNGSRVCYAPVLSLAVYFGVIILGLAISFVKPLFFVRYTMAMYGFVIFDFAYLLSKIKTKATAPIIIALLILLCVYRSQDVYKNAYACSPDEIHEYIDPKLEDGDIFVFRRISNGSVLSIQYRSHRSYFYNKDFWDVEKAYQAYAPSMEVKWDLSFLDDYTGRVWIADEWYGEDSLYNELYSMDNVTVISKPQTIYSYHDIDYIVSLVDIG